MLIIRRSKLYYTASGIVTPIGGRLVHRLREEWFTVHETATYKCDDTGGCVIQFWPPDDEHMCSKHVKTRNKLTVKQKFCASSWLITEINILRCTVSETSKRCVKYGFPRLPLWVIRGQEGGRRFSFPHETATYRCGDTRDFLTSWWWAHVLDTCRGVK